jgi:hypothetical protein
MIPTVAVERTNTSFYYIRPAIFIKKTATGTVAVGAKASIDFRV